MRPSSTINRPTQNAQTQSLHPVLKAALGSLDVQLEEELTRYRRQRALGKSGYSPRKAAAKAAVKALQPPAIAPQAPANQLSVSGKATEVAPSIVAPSMQATNPELIPSDLPGSKSYLELKELAKQYASQIDQEAELAASEGGPESYLESSEELLRSLADEEAGVQAEQGFLKSLSTPLGIGSMLLLLLSSAMFGFVIMNPSSLTQWFSKKQPEVATNSTNPSVSEPLASNVPQPNLAEQEFADLNLSTLGSLKVDGVPAANLRTPAKPSTRSSKTPQKGNSGSAGKANSGAGAGQLPARSAAATPLEGGSSLSGAEPVPPAGDVPSPRRLAPAPDYNPPPARSYRSPSIPTRSYTPPASSSYSAPSSAPSKPSQPRTTAPSKSPTPAKKSAVTSPAPSIPPLKPTPEPSPSTTSSPVAPSNSSSPSPSPSASSSPSAGVSNGYKVVVPYTSDRALEQARQKVPDAYLQNYSDGAKVQMGAYDTEATAKQRAEELRQQGIPAEVYKP